MCEPDITVAERAAVLEVLGRTTLALGPRLELFERRLAASRGRAPRHRRQQRHRRAPLCMLAAGVGEGDVVLTTPFSFVASANCILYVRARPVFVDIDPITLTLDPAALERDASTRERRAAAAR